MANPNIVAVRAADVVVEPQRDAQREVRERGDKSHHARTLRTEEQASNGAGERNREHQREDGKLHQNSTQVIAATSPRSITSA